MSLNGVLRGVCAHACASVNGNGVLCVCELAYTCYGLLCEVCWCMNTFTWRAV